MDRAEPGKAMELVDRYGEVYAWMERKQVKL